MWDLLVLPLTAGAPALQIGVRRITKMSKLSKLQIVQTRSFRTQYNINRCGVCVTTCCHPNSGNCPGKKGVRTFFPEFALRRRQEIVRVRHVNKSRNISVTFRRGANLHTLAPPEKKFIKMSHLSYIFRCCRLASVFVIMLKCSMFAPGRNLLSVKLTRRKKKPIQILQHFRRSLSQMCGSHTTTEIPFTCVLFDAESEITEVETSQPRQIVVKLLCA